MEFNSRIKVVTGHDGTAVTLRGTGWEETSSRSLAVFGLRAGGQAEVARFPENGWLSVSFAKEKKLWASTSGRCRA